MQRNQSFVLHPASKIYLKALSYSRRSIDFSTQAPAYPKKQYWLEQTLHTNLITAFPFAMTGEPGTNLQDAFIEAAAMQAEFLVYPYVADYENRLNTPREISEGRGIHDRSYGLDHMAFTIVIFDVYSQQMLDSIQIDATSAWFAGDSALKSQLDSATRVAVQSFSAY